VISFNASAIHPYDLGVLLDRQGIAVRTGHHCCQPLMKRFGLEGTCRASFSFYNSFEEVDLFIAALHRSLKMLS
jgi:cysteine desulfurase/selenocysteine lyase